MTNDLHISGSDYLELMLGGAARMNEKIDRINELNVFPIPDGDTGDNMYMTMRSGISATERGKSLSKVSSDIARGMLLGARGNSGVILSRIFYGIAEGFTGVETADLKDLITAMRNGIRQAYGAVSEPVEGTILTVYREAVENTIARADETMTLTEGLYILVEEARKSLEKTPEMLKVLKDAGVVDSGGAGLLYLLEGMRNAAEGRTGKEPLRQIAAGPETPDLSVFTEDSVMEFGYCTEFLLRLTRSKTDIDAFDIDDFRSRISGLGDSLVVFQEGTIVKVHIHSFTPHAVLEFGQRYGEFLTVKIENMCVQHHGMHAEAKRPEEEDLKMPEKPFGAVAAAMGDGIRETFLSMGADAVVGGGQCASPSAADFIRAFEETRARTIFVFPGDANIILTARQAAALYDRSDVRVIPCKSIGDSYAALSALDYSGGDPDEIASRLTDALKEAVCGSVSRASRDASLNGIHIHERDFIGYSGNKVLTDKPTRPEALYALAEALNAGDYGVMLVLCGADVGGEEKAEAEKTLAAAYRRTEVILQDGGQPVQDYILLLQ